MTKYRLVTPPHMDVIVPFPSQEEAIREAAKRAQYRPTMLYVMNKTGGWQLLFPIENEKEKFRTDIK